MDSKAKPIFEKKVGAYIGKRPSVRYFPSKYRFSWPLANLKLFGDCLIIEYPKLLKNNKFKIFYKDIKNVQLGLLLIQINHSDNKIPKCIYFKGKFGGVSLYKEIMKIISNHNLKLNILPPDFKIDNSIRITHFLLCQLPVFAMIFIFFWFGRYFIGIFLTTVYIIIFFIFIFPNFKKEILV